MLMNDRETESNANSNALSRRALRTWRVGAALSALACAVVPLSGCAGQDPGAEPGTIAQALASSGLVISQVYGGGGATAGSPSYQRDFVEIFNRGTAPVSLGGLSLQYGAAGGDFGGTLADGGTGFNVFPLPNVTLDPGHYYLVGMTPGTAGQPLDVDAVGTLTLAAASGKVVLANTTASLSCGGEHACTDDSKAKFVDLVGYGTASFSETAPTAVLSNTTAALRNGNGCGDTDNNSGTSSSHLAGHHLHWRGGRLRSDR